MSVLVQPAVADARDWERSSLLFQLQGRQVEVNSIRYQRSARDATPSERDSRSRPRDIGRLTEEERSGLHRDLDRARLELYRRGRGR